MKMKKSMKGRSTMKGKPHSFTSSMTSPSQAMVLDKVKKRMNPKMMKQGKKK